MQQSAQTKTNITKIVVGSTNPVKIAAVASVVSRVWPEATVIGVAVDSGVDPQPLTDEEAIVGATNRAERALATGRGELGVGLEGNTVETAYGMFGTGWAVVVGRSGARGIGSSGRLLLPDVVARGVRQGGELGPLMDKLAGEQNTKHRQGAVGILTDGLMTRQGALEIAVIYALAPFVQPVYD